MLPLHPLLLLLLLLRPLLRLILPTLQGLAGAHKRIHVVRIPDLVKLAAAGVCKGGAYVYTHPPFTILAAKVKRHMHVSRNLAMRRLAAPS